MKQINIKGNKKLNGTIRISGSKNAAVALIPAAILSDEEVTLCNVPEISDVDALEKMLQFLGADIKRATESIVINSKNVVNKELPTDLSKTLRASYYFMGVLLAKYKKVEMCFPGGCGIGARPIDIHLDGFKKLGATVLEEGDKYTITAEQLVGCDINLKVASVGATINLMFVASKAKGQTRIINAAREPEIVNVAELLNNMGAIVEGAGTDVITIKGVDYLHGGFIEVIPDRIEAGTYVIIGSLIGNPLNISNVVPEHIKSLTDKLQEAGANILLNGDTIVCKKSDNLSAINVETFYFPGFPTDLQQPMSVFLTQCNGVSTIKENIYENRFMHIPYLNRMGASIETKDREAIIKGKTKLHGSDVVATDLRGGASMIIAGLIANGKTSITEIDHILRGYDKIIEKLKDVGADISLEEFD